MKFDDQSLQDLVDQDLSKEQIAQRLGVTKMAVHHRLKKLKSRQAKVNPEVLAETDRVDCKAPLTVQEKLFLDLHLMEGKSVKDAMIQAGYGDLPQRTVYFRAKKIVRKLEGRTADARQIMRTVGCGEVAVISRLWREAKTSQSAGARVTALVALGKWLGMDKEQVSGAAGVQIIIQATQGSPTQVNVGAPGPTTPAEPGQTVTVSYQHPTGPPGRPIQITK